MSSEDHYEMREYHIDVLKDERDPSPFNVGRPYPIYPSKGGLNPTFISDAIQRFVTFFYHCCHCNFFIRSNRSCLCVVLPKAKHDLL